MYYPKIDRELLDKRNLAIEVFGQRIYDSQTLYEYLIEFLLVFISPKGWGKANLDIKPFQFPFPKGVCEQTDKLYYAPTARVGLKRFIFFERSKQEHRFLVDEDAYCRLLEALRQRLQVRACQLTKDDALSALQDLFYGFSAVIKNRAWFAQSLLPLTPELTFCESMGNAAKRKRMHERDLTFEDIDGGFGFQQHDFLARGGEVYFLHLLRGLLVRAELKERLEAGLRKLLVESFPQFTWLAKWIETNWLEYMKQVTDSEVNEIVITKSCEWIPEGYSRRAGLACEELVNLLESELPALQKLDLLAKGIVLHILRMLHEQAAAVARRDTQSSDTNSSPGPVWVVQIGNDTNSNIRKYSIRSYRTCEEDFIRALDVQASRPSEIISDRAKGTATSRAEEIREGSRHSLRVFRRLGKDIGLVVPPKGGHMRFALNEDLIKFLVISTIKPGTKLLLSRFLEKLYRHYGLIIGPEELKHTNLNLSAGDFDSNRANFQEMLKQCGFLRDLSDATSIVENPFGGKLR